MGYDFSRIRPQGARINGMGLGASGSCHFIEAFDKACVALQTTGARRGAQMAVLRCDHPDVEAFIRAKDSGDLRNFNISVGITDGFMQAVADDADFDLVHKAAPGPTLKAAGARQREDGQWVYRTLRARTLWDQIMRSTYDHAEPGVLFLDRINNDNNLNYCETIAAKNALR